MALRRCAAWALEALRDGERRWAGAVALLTVAVSIVPYAAGVALGGPGRGWYSGLAYNLDDACVFMSWIRQYADGHLTHANLFTTAPQSGLQFNLLFLLLGWSTRVTGLSPLATLHGARILGMALLLHCVWWLFGMLAPDARARRAAYLFACVGAGLGWVPGLWRDSGFDAPTDVWQPETVTYLSMYLSPLFSVSLALICCVIGFLVMGDRTRQMRWAVLAGVCALALGNIHTYDIITLMLVWGAYRFAEGAACRRMDWPAWGRALVVGAFAGISSGCMFWVARTEAVFARRIAVETLSGPAWQYLLGLGLLLPLAVAGVLRLRREPGRAWLLPVVWLVAALVAAYLPLPFQRKLAMGLQLPAAVLAGVGFAGLCTALRGRRWGWALAAGAAMVLPTNVRFMLRDVQRFAENRAQTGLHRPYLTGGEMRALAWLRAHAARDDAFQPLPWVAVDESGRYGFLDASAACFGPGITGRRVNAGHFGETPDFGAAMNAWARFLRPDATPSDRVAQLHGAGVRYVVFTQCPDWSADELTRRTVLLPFLAAAPETLRRIDEASGPEAILYEVRADLQPVPHNPPILP